MLEKIYRCVCVRTCFKQLNRNTNTWFFILLDTVLYRIEEFNSNKLSQTSHVCLLKMHVPGKIIGKIYLNATRDTFIQYADYYLGRERCRDSIFLVRWGQKWRVHPIGQSLPFWKTLNTMLKKKFRIMKYSQP